MTKRIRNYCTAKQTTGLLLVLLTVWASHLILAMHIVTFFFLLCHKQGKSCGDGNSDISL